MAYFLIIACIFFTSVSCSPRVEIEKGKLIGTNYTLPNGRVVNAFLGVPFAAPPIGRLRFEDPKPVKRWFGYRNATQSSEYCVQFPHTSELSEFMGTEDCLYLDVYTPRLPKNGSKNLMNVMFYIFGGGFSFGGGKRVTPDYLLQDEDMVFVSSNYRVGLLGFFSAGDEIAPGNNALKDSVEALRWVQKNIHHFGGDPTKVTIYGASSGAGSIQYLLVSPLSKGLFHNAVSTSGSVLNPWAAPHVKRIENSFALASSVNCPTFNTRLMMLCLKRKPAKKLYEASFRFYKGNAVVQIPFGPVIEPKFEGAFISEHPYDSLKNGHVHDVPYMVGVTENEGSTLIMDILYNQTLTTMNDLNEKWNIVAPVKLLYDDVNSTSKRDHISSTLRQYYFGNRTISNRTTKTLFQIAGDRLFTNGIIKSAKLYRSAVSKNVFCYKFYYRGKFSHCSKHSNPIKPNYGACHGDDQWYLVGLNRQGSPKSNEKSEIDLDMVQLLTSSVVAFMKTGNPNIPDMDWQPLTPNGTMNCLNIYSYTHQRMVDIEESEVTKFWDETLQSEY